MKMSLQELDVVALTVDLPNHGLMKGRSGTIVLVHAPRVFQVEFPLPYGQLPIVATVEEDQLRKLDPAPEWWTKGFEAGYQGALLDTGNLKMPDDPAPQTGNVVQGETPLDIATAAFVESYNQSGVSAIGRLNRWECTEHTRAALLALAENIPLSVALAGLAAYEGAGSMDDTIRAIFRAMLHEVAHVRKTNT
jgi:hypothetical protein